MTSLSKSWNCWIVAFSWNLLKNLWVRPRQKIPASQVDGLVILRQDSQEASISMNFQAGLARRNLSLMSPIRVRMRNPMTSQSKYQVVHQLPPRCPKAIMLGLERWCCWCWYHSLADSNAGWWDSDEKKSAAKSYSLSKCDQGQGCQEAGPNQRVQKCLPNASELVSY